MARTTKGRIFQRGKHWHAQYYLNGRQVTQSLGTTNKRDAIRRLEELVAGLRLANKTEQAKAAAARLLNAEKELAKWQEEHRPRLALTGVWPKYLTARNRPQSGAHTLADYGRHWKRFLEWMAKNRPDCINAEEVTAADAEAFLLYLEGLGLGANRYNKSIQALRLIFRVIAPFCPGKTNPFIDCQAKPLAPERHRELSEAELMRVCSSATGELRTLLALGLYCGFRIADAAQLRWEEIDLHAGVIVRAPSKTHKRTGKQVAIPVHPVLATILLETTPAERLGPLLPNFCESYRRDNGSTLAKIIHNHFKSCGIETTERLPGHKRAVARATFHSFRHSLVSTLARHGVPLASVRELVGHTSEAVQRAYLHTTTEDMRQAVNVLPNVAPPAALLSAGDATSPPAEDTGIASLRARLHTLVETAPLAMLKRWETLFKPPAPTGTL